MCPTRNSPSSANISGNEEFPPDQKPIVVRAPLDEIPKPVSTPVVPAKPADPVITPSGRPVVMQTADGRLQWVLERATTLSTAKPTPLQLTLRAKNKASMARHFGYLQVKFTAGDADADLLAGSAAVVSAAGSDRAEATSVSVASTFSPTPLLSLNEPITKKGRTWWTAEVGSGDAVALMVPADGSVTVTLDGMPGAQEAHEILVIESWANEKGEFEDRKELKLALTL